MFIYARIYLSINFDWFGFDKCNVVFIWYVILSSAVLICDSNFCTPVFLRPRRARWWI